MYIIICLDLVFCIYFIQFYSWNKIDTQRNTAQHSATHYNTLQHPSKLCHTLHHTRYRVAKTHRMPYLQVISRKRATNYRAHLRKIKYKDKASFDSMPPCMSLASTIDMRHSHALQQSATLCNTLNSTATHCNTLQHTATHCNTWLLLRVIFRLEACKLFVAGEWFLYARARALARTRCVVIVRGALRSWNRVVEYVQVLQHILQHMLQHILQHVLQHML